MVSDSDNDVDNDGDNFNDSDADYADVVRCWNQNDMWLHVPFVIDFKIICSNVNANIMIPISTSGADQLWAIPTNVTAKYDELSVKHAKTLLYSFPEIQSIFYQSQ